MLRKMVGAIVGYQASQYTRQINGPAGAALGAITPVVIRRLGIVGVMGLAAGTYLAARVLEQRRMDRVFGNMPMVMSF